MRKIVWVIMGYRNTFAEKCDVANLTNITDQDRTELCLTTTKQVGKMF